MHLFFFFFFYKQKNEGRTLQSAASQSDSHPPPSHYCWCDWDKRGWSRRGRDKHELREVQTIKHLFFENFSLPPPPPLAPNSFPPQGPRKGKKKKRPCKRYSSISTSCSKTERGIGGRGGGAFTEGREDVMAKYDADDLGIGSRRCFAVSPPAFFHAFPAAEHFTTCSSSFIPFLFFSVLVEKSCTCFIPCLPKHAQWACWVFVFLFFSSCQGVVHLCGTPHSPTLSPNSLQHKSV